MDHKQKGSLRKGTPSPTPKQRYPYTYTLNQLSVLQYGALNQKGQLVARERVQGSKETNESIGYSFLERKSANSVIHGAILNLNASQLLETQCYI